MQWPNCVTLLQDLHKLNSESKVKVREVSNHERLESSWNVTHNHREKCVVLATVLLIWSG